MRACLLACALAATACGSGSGKGDRDASDAGAGEAADAGWYVPDAGPPTTMRLTGRVEVLGAGPRAGGTLRLLHDDFESNRTCGGTVCVTGAIEP